jgi:S-adenosylmethionine uptake transporter
MSSTDRSSVMTGIGLAIAGYAAFSAQDAIVKWLVVHYSVFEILFVRSLFILGLALAATRGRSFAAALGNRTRTMLLVRSAMILVAWLSYYTAARDLPLADLVTLYFAAPIFVVVLSFLILREKVTAARWIAAIVGFAGVILAVDPSGSVSLVPAVLALTGAFTWAWTTILVRIISRTELTTTTMTASNLLFAVACAIALPWVWQTPSTEHFAVMALLGIMGGAGQFLVFEGFRHAPASAIAPFEYSGLIWAFVWGYAIFAEVPRTVVFAGAALILASGVGLFLWEAAAGRRTRW